MQRSNSLQPTILEKGIACGSYITFGFVGFAWLLVALITKNSLRPFLKYHVFQSVFVAIFYFLLCTFINLIMDILSMIPILNVIIMQVTFYLNAPLIFGWSVVQLIVNLIIFYLIITTLQGRYSYLPWISEIIKANIKN